MYLYCCLSYTVEKRRFAVKNTCQRIQKDHFRLTYIAQKYLYIKGSNDTGNGKLRENLVTWYKLTLIFSRKSDTRSVSHWIWFSVLLYFRVWGARVSKVPITFWALKAKFEIKACWIVAQFLAHKPVNFASLTDSFIVSFSKLLKLWSWMKTRQTLNSFSGPKSYRDFQEMGLLASVEKLEKISFLKRRHFSSLESSWSFEKTQND